MVPASYKEANACPVPKKGDLPIVSNHRPISLLNSENKLFKRLVFKHMYNHLHRINLLSSLQSGFIPGDSTVNQLTYLYNTFCQALDVGKEVRVVFCDISKAFDRVWHAGLLLNSKRLASRKKFWLGLRIQAWLIYQFWSILCFLHVCIFHVLFYLMAKLQVFVIIHNCIN